jgi:diadenosine tetraphosphatase ApaH/serine/threonine PP2A family protein phosphatase
MKLGIVSDIHGNREALEAVLADVTAQGVESLACLGDFVGYGASPNECIGLLRPRVEVAVLGNHDVAALGRLKLGGFQSDAATTARWTMEQLEPGARTWLEALPYDAQWHGVRLVHATPSEPEEWHYVLSIADAELEFGTFRERIGFIGHSHVPGVFETDGAQYTYTRAQAVTLRAGRRYLVNIGSVGQPRDGDPRAAWMLFDDERDTLEHRRVNYDIAASAQRILAAGLPPFLAERLKWGE